MQTYLEFLKIEIDELHQQMQYRRDFYKRIFSTPGGLAKARKAQNDEENMWRMAQTLINEYNRLSEDTYVWERAEYYRERDNFDDDTRED